MKKDSLKQFVALRDSLQAEKTTLERRLREINSALSVSAGSSSPAAAEPAARRGRGPARKRRARNKMSLRAVVTQVTSSKPRTKAEILQEIDKLGYRFSSKNPMNSLNTVLYTKPKFKNNDGLFSPGK